MKRLCFLLLMSWFIMNVTAQNVVYSNLKRLLACDGDTVTSLKVEKRSKNSILMTGGADYKISVGSDGSMCKYLKSRCFAVLADTSLYINCKRLRYKKLRFGGWYAPALRIGDHIFFSAIPLGSVIAGDDATMDVMLGGELGDAIAASALIFKRVYYEINPKTGKVEFVSKERMEELLENHPDWKASYQNDNSESAAVIDNYLRLLKSEDK